MDKATVHLEPCPELLFPTITAYIIREKDHPLASQFTHHVIGEIVAFSNRQLVNVQFRQRTQQGCLFLLHNGDRLV